MPEIKDKIGNGINFEENVISFIASEIASTKGYAELPPEKKDGILSRLKILIRDSERHRQLLTELAKKY